MDRRNFAFNIDDSYLVLSASAIKPDELDRMCYVVVEAARFLGVID
jgi:hypothetical protein